MTGGINRRDAIMVSLGLGDRVALEREQQSAIDAVRGHAENQETEEESGDSVPSEPAASTSCSRAGVAEQDPRYPPHRFGVDALPAIHFEPPGAPR